MQELSWLHLMDNCLIACSISKNDDWAELGYFDQQEKSTQTVNLGNTKISTMSATNFKIENNNYRKLVGNGLTYRIPRF